MSEIEYTEDLPNDEVIVPGEHEWLAEVGTLGVALPRESVWAPFGSSTASSNDCTVGTIRRYQRYRIRRPVRAVRPSTTPLPKTSEGDRLVKFFFGSHK